jgi:hypothetical protein
MVPISAGTNGRGGDRAVMPPVGNGRDHEVVTA